MSGFRALQSVTLRPRLRVALNGSTNSAHRSLATTPDSPTLPLSGIRVLDMTRVLAGVCRSSASANTDLTLSSRTVRKFWETLGRP